MANWKGNVAQSEHDDEDEQDEDTQPIPLPGSKGQPSTLCESSDERREEERVSEVEKVEDKDDSGQTAKDDEDDSGQTAEDDEDEAFVELNGPDEKPFTPNHYEDDKQEKGEREWQPEDVPQDGRPPRGKWPIVKYASFVRLRLPDLHEKLVTLMPGIGVLGERLSIRGIDTMCCSIFS